MKPVVFSSHAVRQALERGASEDEVVRAIREGKAEPAKHGRLMYRLSMEYDAVWAGKHYRIKQVALEHGLMSAYTAFVAVDSLTRTAGDHGTTVPVPVPMPKGVRYETTVQE